MAGAYVGIAEANVRGIAAGLALDGKITFVSTFATFASMCDTVRPLDVETVVAAAREPVSSSRSRITP